MRERESRWRPRRGCPFFRVEFPQTLIVNLARGQRLPPHVGVDWRGMDRVAADLVLRVLDRGALRQDAHRALRGVVIRRVRAADDSGDRGQIDDRSPAGRTHRRQHRLRTEEDALHVDFQHPVQVARARVFDEAPRVDAGIVDEHRRRSERLAYPRDRSAHCDSEATSSGTKYVRWPSALSVSLSAAPSSARTSVSATDAPSTANRRATAAPIPTAAPVTRATFPSSLMVDSPSVPRSAANRLTPDR